MTEETNILIQEERQIVHLFEKRKEIADMYYEKAAGPLLTGKIARLEKKGRIDNLEFGQPCLNCLWRKRRHAVLTVEKRKML
jgi:hypothetical protein